MFVRSPFVAAVMMMMAITGPGCTCNRNGLSTRFGDLVIVVPASGSAAPEVLTREASLRIDPVVMGQHGSGSVTLRNVGDAQVTLKHVSYVSGSNAFTLELPSATELPAQSEVTLTVSFSPPQDPDATLAAVRHTAVFQLEAGGTREEDGVLRIELTADALAGDCQVPSGLDFGLVPVGRSATVVLQLTATPALSQSISVSVIEGDDAVFFGGPSESPITIENGASTPVPFTFSPLDARRFTAHVTIQRGASCASGVVTLTGSAGNDVLEFSPRVLDFGRAPLGLTVQRTLTFKNLTSVVLTLSGAVLSGETAFTMAAPASWVLAPAASVTIMFSFTPASLGAFAGAFELEADTVPESSLRVVLTGVGGGPRIRAHPSPSFDFGQVPFVQSAPGIGTTRRVTVQNVGTLSGSPNDSSMNLFFGQNGEPPFIALTLGNSQTFAREFQVSLSAWDVDGGLPAVPGHNSVDLDVRFTPSSLGLKQAALSIYSNDAIEPVVTVSIGATAVAASLCTFSVSPGVVSFGDLPNGALAKRSVFVSNTSATPCFLTGIEIAPGSAPAFGVDGAGDLIVPAGRSVSIVVTALLTGTSQGDFSTGYLRFSVNSKTTPAVLVPLGTRTASCLVTAPLEVDYGSVRVGCKSAAKPMTIYNACGGSVKLTSIEIAPSHFSIISSPTLPAGGLELQPSSSVSVSTVFTPIATGSEFSTLFIKSSEGNGFKTTGVTLRAIGIEGSIVTETFTQSGMTAKADLLFVVDNSGSMQEEQAELASNFLAFIDYANQLTIDYRIGVTTTDDDPPGAQGGLLRTSTNPMVLTSLTPNVATRFSEKVNVGVTGSGHEQPFATALKAVTEPLASTGNANFLRTGASLSVIIVTDATDQSPEPVSYYLNRFLGLVPVSSTWLFSLSVIGPFTPPPLPAGCVIDGASDDGRFASMVAATNGVRADICTTDWARDLKTIGQNALGPRGTLFLVGAPDQLKPITVTIDGRPTTEYDFEPMTNSIVLRNTALTPPGSKVAVTYSTACY